MQRFEDKMEEYAGSSGAPSRQRDAHGAIPVIDVFGSRVDAVSYERLWQSIAEWAQRPEPHRICLAGIPTVIFSRDDPEFREAHGSADVVVPDGMPLVWHIRRAGYPRQERLDGPNLIPRLCADAERNNIPVGFYGSTPEKIRKIRENIIDHYPRLDLRFCKDAPFLPTSEERELEDVEEINQSGARLVFIGLSCPKQELWMARQRDRLMATSVAVGGAFDVVAGEFQLPPVWVQKSGFQWLYRLFQEPRRLWRRYLVQNSRYIGLVAWSRLGGNTQLP